MNQLNTQAMLVAGCAVANLSGESLQIVEEGRWAAEVLAVAFVATSALTLGCSLWVIFMSSNLIQLSQQAALQGTRAQDVRGADRILTKRSEEVRGFYKQITGVVATGKARRLQRRTGTHAQTDKRTRERCARASRHTAYLGTSMHALGVLRVEVRCVINQSYCVLTVGSSA